MKNFLVVVYCSETIISYAKEGTQTEGFREQVVEKIFGPKEEDVKGDWIKFLKEKLHVFCYSLNIMSRLRIICSLHIANVKLNKIYSQNK